MRDGVQAAVKLGRRREPQQARSEQTQEKLLRATIECLVEDGYAGLKTAMIARRAGLSEGGLFRHYPSKADLLVAAVARIFLDLQEEFDRLTRQTAAGRDPLRDSLRALWRVMSSPAYLATNEVYLAARTDRALHAVIRPMALQHQSSLMERARQLRGGVGNPQGDEDFDALVLMLQAVAVDSVALQDPAIERRRLRYLEALAHRLFAGASEEARTRGRKSIRKGEVK